jgi:hypothetical protein
VCARIARFPAGSLAIRARKWGTWRFAHTLAGRLAWSGDAPRAQMADEVWDMAMSAYDEALHEHAARPVAMAQAV